MANPLSKLLRQKGLECLLYLTHPDNLRSITQYGILSRGCVERCGIRHEDISNVEVQARRDREVFGRPLHDYIPLYMARRNPMLWTLRNLPRAYIRVSLEVADKDGTAFSNCNASSYWARFYQGSSNIDQLPWDVILAPTWTQFPDGKRKRCAEVLVPEIIEPSFILDIRCKYIEDDLVLPECKSLLLIDHDFLKA